MLSAHGERWRIIEAIKLGVNEFLCKPVSAKALLDRLVSILLKPRESVQFDGYYGPAPRRSMLTLPGFGPQVAAGRLIRSNLLLWIWRRSRCRRRGGLLGCGNRRGRGRCRRCAGQPFDHRTHGIAGAAFAHRIEQRRRGAGAADQSFCIRQHDRIVPRALHHKGQSERRCAGAGRRSPARPCL